VGTLTQVYNEKTVLLLGQRSSLYFNAMHVVICLVYSKHAVSLLWGMSNTQFTNESLF